MSNLALGEDSSPIRRMSQSLIHNDEEAIRPIHLETKESKENTTNNARPRDELDDLEFNTNFTSSSFTSIFSPVVLTMTLAAIAVVNINSATTRGLGEGLKLYVPPALQPSAGEGAGDAFLKTAGFAALFICFVCGATFIIVLIIRCNCYKCLIGYMLFSITAMLGFMGGTAVYAVFEMKEVCADLPSFIFVMYNFAIVGVISIFWKKGMDNIWTNAYLVSVSVILSFQLAQFNSVGEWFPWCILGALAMYDLCAVLTPWGPLKLLLDAVESNEGSEVALSGLLFEADVGQHHDAEATARSQVTRAAGRTPAVALTSSSPSPSSSSTPTPPPSSSSSSSNLSMESTGEQKNDNNLTETDSTVLLEEGMTNSTSSTSSTDAQAIVPIERSNNGKPPPLPSARGPSPMSPPQGRPRPRGRPRGPPPPRPPQQQLPTEEEDGPRGVKLGLGDFIFYSVLVSTAARHDFITFAACTLSVLFGLGLTLLLLIVAGKALPALPISIALGTFFYFVGRYTLEPYIDQMALYAVII